MYQPAFTTKKAFILLLLITMVALAAPEDAKEERHEPLEIVDQKAQTLADQIRNSKHLIAFTGAGISTSAGQLQYLTRINLGVESF